MGDVFFPKYGRPKVSQIVSRFYSRVLESPALRHYFDGVHIRTLVDHQAAFMEAVMGGGLSHTREQLLAIHSRLGIADPDFDEMIGILRDTLGSFDVERQDIDDVIDRYEALRDVIVSTKS